MSPCSQYKSVLINAPQLRKHTFWHVCQKKTKIRLRIRVLLSVLVVRMKKPCVLIYPKCGRVKILIRECAVSSESSMSARLNERFVPLRLRVSNFNFWTVLNNRPLRGQLIHTRFVLRSYGPVNPMGSCRERSVYLTTRLLGRLSPLSG